MIATYNPEEVYKRHGISAGLETSLKIPSTIYCAYFAHVTPKKHQAMQFIDEKLFEKIMSEEDNSLVILVKRPDILYVDDFLMSDLKNINSFLRNMKTDFKSLESLRKKSITAYANPDDLIHTIAIGVKINVM